MGLKSQAAEQREWTVTRVAGRAENALSWAHLSVRDGVTWMSEMGSPKRGWE